MGIVFGKTGVAEPAFDILLSRSSSSSSSSSIPYEIRKYGVRYAIETEYPMGRDSEGFRALAGYIGVGTQPQNIGSESIAMTAPVITESSNKSAGGTSGTGGEKIAMTAPVVTSSKDTTTTSTTTRTAGKGAKIAMTAPVITTSKEENTKGKKMKKMQFILPQEYNAMSKIPKPTNPNVSIKKVPSATGAVHTFSGFVNEEKAKAKAVDLARQLKTDGLDSGDTKLSEEEVVENYDLWQFHPPFTLGPLRRNEVWVDLTPKQVDLLLKKFQDGKE